MNCQSVRAHLVDQWDQLHGELQDHDVRRHLDACSDCRRLATEYGNSWQWLQDLPQAEPAENFEWRLRLRLNQIDKETAADSVQQIERSSRVPASLPFLGSALAAAVVVVAVGFVALRAPESALPAGDAVLSPVVQDTTQPSAETTPARLQFATDRPGLPNLAPTRPDFLKVVPVSAGVPLGPETQTPPAPSILGERVVRPVLLPR